MSIIEEWGKLYKLRFSLQKTCMLPITYRRRLSLADPPEVKLYGHAIRAVAELKYLGVIWDGGLTFHSHFKDRKVTIVSLSYRLTLTVCKWYSKQHCLLKRIYKGALEPKALYGHGAWGHRLKLKTFCEYLNVVQRRPLLAMTRAYRTSSTLSLQVLAGVPPLDLRAIETYATFLVLRARKDITVYSESFHYEDYVRMESPFLTHPAVKDGIGFDWKEPKGEGLEVLTDGSSINDKIGAAMVVLYFGQMIHSERVRLGDHCTVYQAELIGLKLAAEFILTLTTTRRVNIYSDSRSALQSLADPTNTHPLVGEVKRLLKRARSERGVFLHWVKAHVGYHGNELADGEAKAAAVSLDLPVSSSRFKCKLKSIMIQAWQDHWDFTPNKGKFTPSIIPKVSLKTHFWGEMAELFTGHGRFPAHLY
ncbi:hypothetical protein AVEN_33317-1 [Araneus ventricosus]|uniref:RNase H type-1 domain-containing protein n=1 Tax=Araneus ventricosus TaxID=182803 RepID=A0A4Y2NUJ7_ARAVE|nr:hypothetical protein AVEN_33317-1 [Araneus ventricosus]